MYRLVYSWNQLDAKIKKDLKGRPVWTEVLDYVLSAHWISQQIRDRGFQLLRRKTALRNTSWL